jgi:hypothetical protein
VIARHPGGRNAAAEMVYPSVIPAQKLAQTPLGARALPLYSSFPALAFGSAYGLPEGLV